MKKMTKLLSVILAFVMALSCMTMMASAARTSYKTADNLTALDAYSPYGTVTRLSTEERISMLLDFLDITLGKANINMGTVVDTMGLTITIDLRSVDSLCGSLDSFKKTMTGSTWKFAAAIVNLGVLEKANFNNWTSGMTRDNTAQLKILNEILKVLKDNTSLVESVLTSGIDLGLVANFIKGLDLSSINKLVTNLPGAIKSIAFPMMARQDDNQAQRDILSNKDSNLLDVAQKFVNGLFTKPMTWTSYRVDEAGNSLGYTTALPTEADGTSRYFVVSASKEKITQYDYNYEGILGTPKAGYKETVTYTKDKEVDSEDCTTYVYRAPKDYSGDQTLKWYKADGKTDENGNIQSGYWLPTVKKAIEDGKLSININGEDSVLGLVYKFIPYLFAEMAPTVLNGSVKQVLAKAFGVNFEYIGKKNSTELTAAIAGVNGGDFFTKAQEYYTWEYSDYKVIDGVPYYRFQDDYYRGELPKDLSTYYYMFNWDWNIADDFLNEFIPATAGASLALDNLNNIVKKAIETVILPSWTVKGTTYNRSEVFNWATGDNSKLIDNLMVCARNFFNISPEEILGDYYKEAQFYEPMMNGTKAQAVNGLVCELVKLIMPQIKFSDDIINQPLTAIAAIVVRELCTQLMPTYNFDAMIYANYGKAGTPTRKLATHSADEWLDITLYMGVNLGMYYLRNIADVGEDSDLGYYSVMANLGALPAIDSKVKNTTSAGDAFTFSANAYKAKDGQASWLVAVDWIVDWALTNEVEWAWHFERLVEVNDTVALASYQNPFNKIDTVILTFLPALENVINTEGLAGTDYGSGTWTEKVLKDGLVDSIVNLDLSALLKMLKQPTESVLIKNNIADTLVQIIVNMLNKIVHKVCGGTNLINTASINSVETLVNHNNLKTVVVNLVGRLYEASNTYNLFDPVMPILNFFVGWTTDPQKYADPILTTTNTTTATNSYNYLFTNGGSSVTTTLSITNNSSGMLLKHRNSSKIDFAYDIRIKDITSSTDSITLNKTINADAPINVGPYESTTVDITIPYTTDKLTDIIVTYEFIGKDGNAVGGEQKAAVYKLVSSTDKVEAPGSGETTASGKDTGSVINKKYAAKVKNWSYPTIHIVNSLDNVRTHEVNIENLVKKSTWVYTLTPAANNNPIFGFDTSVVHGASENEALKAEQIGWMATSASKDDNYNDKIWPAQVARFVDDKFTPVTGEEYNVSYDVTFINGDFGAQGYDNNHATLNVSYKVYYYNVEELTKLCNSAPFSKDYTLTSAEAQSAWTEYLAALYDANFLVNGPVRYDTFKDLYSVANIEKVTTRLKNAIEALKQFSSSSSSMGQISKIEAKLAELETNPDRDINFQDYKLFEYFKYEAERTTARNMINSTKAPAAPEKYIKNGVGGDALVDAIIGAQANANVKAGINATVVETSDPDRAQEMANYNKAVAEFKPAEYSPLNVQDQVSKLQYYYNFMVANTKTISTYFLDNEIAYAEAQNYNSADYSADSWARYTEALANAKAAQSSNKESLIFDAKYELMVAQNKLEKHSMKESGYMNEELVPLIEHANAIINNYGTLYTVKNTVAYADAFGQLVSALGVKYDVSVDGKQRDGILYDRSAITFTEYDRTDTAKNKRAVDAAADKLRAAIENFECTARIESNNDVTDVQQSIRYIQGIVPNSLPTEAALLGKLNVVGSATPVVQASKSGNYGTGARVELKSGDTLLATYFVVIYGDVNGDGAVDAFDAIEVDVANHTAYYMGDVYDDAADIDHNGIVNSDDYAAIKSSVKCASTISQK